MKPYIPDKLPLKNLDLSRFIRLIGQSSAELGRYDGILQGILNPLVLLSPLTTQEAVQSSRIEGTQTTLQEVLKFEAIPSKHDPKYDDIEEVLNYREALIYGTEQLKERGFSLSLLKDMHSILLNGVRGQSKNRGQFRKDQVFIGARGQKKEDAKYIPPEPLLVPEYMENFAQYYNSDDIDFLIQLAIIHAQFEIIHPFDDGNGRIGRMLIPHFLYKKKLLSSPMFYISAYFEKYRDEYCDRLNAITQKSKWEEWIEFFLTAVKEQAEKNSRKAKDIIELYNYKKERILSATSSKHAIRILDALFIMPAFRTSDFIKLTKIPPGSAGRILMDLEKEKIILTVDVGKGSRSTLRVFPALISIVES